MVMGKRFALCAAAAAVSFASPAAAGDTAAESADAVDAAPVTTADWQEAVVSVTDPDRTARFFLEIGGYEVKWRGQLDADAIAAWGLPETASGEALLVGPPGYDSGLVRLVRFDGAGRREPMRPGSRAWDTGCYFSLMIRMKDMQAVYDDAIRLGWWTETPITYLEWGTSKLNVVIYRGPDGVQVQGYERLAPALPEAIPDFPRMSGPFNVMQMVRDRDAAYRFFTGVLGFATFYNGPPYVAAEPTPMPLGIPVNLTTEIPYRAGIVYPTPGEFGRMEMIEIMGLEGRDYSDRCRAPNLGILAVRFPVEDVEAARATIEARGWTIDAPIRTLTVAPYGAVRLFGVKTPDGAIIQFFERTR
jgi:catechol 2,3-dioxygenase-like lactoylglutathione lyase family enzyme